MKTETYKSMKYRKGEKEEMVKRKMPLCYEKRHCNSCMTVFRKMKELEKEDYIVHINVALH